MTHWLVLRRAGRPHPARAGGAARQAAETFSVSELETIRDVAAAIMKHLVCCRMRADRREKPAASVAFRLTAKPDGEADGVIKSIPSASGPTSSIASPLFF